MTLAPAPEAAVVDNDPAQALLSAQADGLLTYRGFVSGNRYEVEAHGRHWTMPAAEALLTVARLRALDRLRRAGALLELVEIRDDGTYMIQTSGGLLVLPEPEVIHWCAGFRAATEGNGERHVGRETIGKIADLFDNTSLDDQCRMVILGLMYGGPQEVTTPALADMIGALPDVAKTPAKKTITGALGFGNFLSSVLREQMIRAFGLRWSVTAGTGSCVSASGAPAGPLPEMPGLVRLRELVAVSRKGWLRYLDKASANDARWRPEYRVSVGQREYTIPGEALMPWLRGLRAFHEPAVGGKR